MERLYLGKRLPNMTAYRPEISGTQGAVSSNCSYVTEAGLEILKKGGNAIDAAVAASLTLGVVDPYNSGIGGGCFAVYYSAKDRDYYALDARGKAPAKAWSEMFLGEDGQPDAAYTENSGRPVATPAMYRAYEQMLRKHGTMTLAQVSEPAIRLARYGFRTGFVYARATETGYASYACEHYPGFKELYTNNGEPRKIGDLVTNPDLADTMEQVAKNGVDWFYNGPIAEEFAAAAQKFGGVIEASDLKNTEAVYRKPIRGTYRGYEIISMPPPSSGGTHLIQMLNVLENFDLAAMGQNSADATHLIAETMKMMFADRSVAMGDPDFMTVQTEKLISKEYARELATRIKMDCAQEYAPSEGIEAIANAGCTTNFTVQDRFGNAVAMTQTIRNWFGCGIPVVGRGFLLNNNMADFSAKCGCLTSQGLAYGNANAVAASKTPLSSMCPVILAKDGVPFVTLGSAGGPRIISSNLQVMVNIMEHGMMMELAVRSPHICCLTKKQGIEMEYAYSPDTIRLLEEKGHYIKLVPQYGVVKGFTNGIMKLNDRFYPAGTWRTNGSGGVLTDSGATCIDGELFLNE